MKETSIEESKAGMRKGMLEYCILLIISRGKIYATDILKVRIISVKLQ